MRLAISFLILAFAFNSEVWAQSPLRCFSLFSHSEENSPQFYADIVDGLNVRNNHFIFEKNLSQFVSADLENKNLPARTKARYQAFRFRRLLSEMKTAESWDRYDFEIFAKRLEQLTFLSDASLTKKMSLNDRILYRQARHSLLAKGLENFLFDGTKASLSVRQKVFNWLMIPFKDIYSRWTFAFIMMPKLHGAILPLELAERIAWEGLDANRELLAPYLKHSQFKSFFNVFSSTYNWALVGAIFVGLPAYSYWTYTQLAERGAEQVQILFTPMLEQSKRMAETDYHQVAEEKTKTHFLEEFKLQMGRDPNQTELALINKLR